MLTFLLLIASQTYLGQIEVVTPTTVIEYNCEIVPVNNVLVDYRLPTNKIALTLDCTKIFKDSFE